MPTDHQRVKRLGEEFEGVYISYAPAQKDFGEQSCVDIKSRGRHVVHVLKESGIFVVITSEEFLTSTSLMLDSVETVRLKKII